MYINPNQITDIKRAMALINDASDILVAVQRWFDTRTNENTANADAVASTLAHAAWNTCDALLANIEINPDYED